MSMEEMNTRERILETAKRLFADRSFEGVSIRDITGAAGVNTSMISYYFRGKDGLYEAIFESEFMSMVRFLSDEETLKNMPPRERIIYLVDKVVEMHTKHPDLARLLHHEMLHPTRMYSEKIVKGVSLLAETFRMTFQEGIEKGIFRSDLKSFEMSYALASMVNYQFIFSGLLSTIMDNLNVSKVRTESLISILLEGIENR